MSNGVKKYLTSEGFEKLKKELGYLEKVKRKEISEMLRQAASEGDLSENAGYDAAKDKQGFVEGRIRELKKIITQAEVIEKKENGKVCLGSFVFLKSNEGKEKFQLVSPEEADILNNKISFKSPLGEALLNKRKGDIVRINVPDGKKEYEIEEIN
ncbi:transcription elongation factor GreA [Patescibacteria group bacterium]|nr:transcription elongation factor GreA [Patescibacteria group bacterium]MBU4480965.1 transcription elongation factor GreA [Patescibacteria group bacterium]